MKEERKSKPFERCGFTMLVCRPIHHLFGVQPKQPCLILCWQTHCLWPRLLYTITDALLFTLHGGGYPMHRLMLLQRVGSVSKD